MDMACLLSKLLLMISVYCLNTHECHADSQSSLGVARNKEQSMMGPVQYRNTREASTTTGNEDQNKEEISTSKFKEYLSASQYNRAINQLKQDIKMNNVVIYGLRPLRRNESINKIIFKLGYRLGFDNPMEGVVKAWRIPLYNKNNGCVAIQLNNSEYKNKWLRTARAIELWKEKIYINEHLTKPNAKLLEYTRKVAYGQKWNFVWTRDCQVFMKKDTSASSMTYKVTSIAQVRAILNITEPLNQKYL
uniref:FP protein C-terminal domain-containing protein n=1 Tax=Cacopsylla melanoneura TaxID=428564 RepID=A0A8D9B6F6_9HEMI